MATRKEIGEFNMAKDPALLWYWGDWFSGTSLMSRFLKGCYMDLLHSQFNNGHLSLEQIKFCLGSDFGQAWPTLQSKFKKDSDGLFFNERHELEKLKRQKFVGSRSNNKSGRKQSYDKSYENHTNNHMIYHMENEDENRDNSIGGTGEKEEGVKILQTKNQEIQMNDFKKHPIDELYKSYIAGPGYQAAREAICISRNISPDRLKELCQQFVMHLKSTAKFETEMRDFVTHFNNWSRVQKDKKPEIVVEPKRKTSADLLKKMGY